MKKNMRRQEMGIPWSSLLIYLCCSFVVTTLLLLLLAVLLYKADLSREIVSGGITVTYVLSTFLGGFLAGKRMKEKRFLWGLSMGAVYFVILLIVSVAANGSFKEVTDSFFTTLILCIGGGMLGGMLS